MTSSTVDRAASAAGVPWDQQRVTAAPYALVRFSTVPYPSPAGAAQRFRQVVRDLVECERRCATLSGPLGQDLYDSRQGTAESFHRKVVLPLRRDIHNGRVPGAALRSRLGDLPGRLPRLAQWLAVVDERERLCHDLSLATAAALAADRAALAQICSAEPVRRAVALSSTDLLVGLDRAAACGAEPDARARKAEPKVLRYALRATTKTSPWSWFTAVGWGHWDDDNGADAGKGDRDAYWTDLVPVSLPNQVLVTRLVHGLLEMPEIRGDVPHRLAPALTVGERHVEFLRDEFSAVLHLVLTNEQRVRLPRTGALDLVVAGLRQAGPGGRTLRELTAALAARLPAGRADSAGAFVNRLAAEQLLVPVAPVHPQTTDPLPALAGWLADRGQVDVADQVRNVGLWCRGFADVPAGDRPAALTRLATGWEDLFVRTGTEMPEAPPVREDVVRRGGLALGRDLRADLVRLAPLTELFNNAAVLRRLVCRRMVDRYGPGGRCRVTDLMTDGRKLWAAALSVPPDGTLSTPAAEYAPLPSALVELAALRREVTAAVRSARRDGDETAIPEDVVSEVAAALPAWLLHRPSSHSYFVQPFRSGGRTGWCVNLVADGWGRFTSRFLGQFGPGPTADVAGQLGRALSGRRVAQYRPAAGFNANLHPLLVDDDLGEDPVWATLSADGLEVVHDAEADVLRLRVAATGQPVNVLYLGFLLQPALADRAMPLYLDLGTSRAALGHLAPALDGPVPRYGRLRYRDVVLARRSWVLDQETVTALRTDLRHDGDVPAAAAARWAARLGLPEATYVSAVSNDPLSDPDALRTYLTSPKPQFVDLGSALHLRCLARLLAQHNASVRIEEALPVPGTGPAGGRAVELVVETYRSGMDNR